MRTEEQFARVYKDALWCVNFHKKHYWIIPGDNGYELSIIKPSPSQVAVHTNACRMSINEDGEIIFPSDIVKSSRDA